MFALSTDTLGWVLAAGAAVIFIGVVIVLAWWLLGVVIVLAWWRSR